LSFKEKILFDLNSLSSEKESIHKDIKFEFYSPISLYGQNHLSGPCNASLDFLYTSRVITCKGYAKVLLKALCNRCLDEVDLKLDVEINEIFNKSKREDSRYICSSEELDFIEDDKLDIIKMITSEIILNLPQTILCREDCKGLCPICGKNRNKEVCNCIKERIDPRMAKLKNFK
jgi:uncharacterized protein